jgi:hypothetical protein
VAEALSGGILTIDKVVELTRLATPETEVELTRWAEVVPPGAIRERAELERRRSVEDTRTAEELRSLRWWHEADRFTMLAELPVAHGAAVRKALDRIVARVPVMPGEDGPFDLAARRADALLALCRARLGADPDPDRATVVVHARLEQGGGFSAGELEDGPALGSRTVERLACTARIQPVLEDERGEALGFGRMRREPSAAMVRQIRYRDRGCVFPGCGTRAFTEAHHVVWWSKGGRTDLDNLVLTCSFHHRLVHEHGWALSRTPSGEVRWFRPGGQRYRAGPSKVRPRSRAPASLG